MKRARPRADARGAVVVALPPKGDREAFLDAAHALSDRAWTRVEADGRSWRAVLVPRGPSRGLAGDFLAAYEAEAVRRAREARGAPLEAAVLSRALEAAAHADARRRRPAATLPPERLAEIARLLAEDEAARAAKGVSPVATPWDRLPGRGGA